ncbi:MULTISPECIES: zincin-like metallopeptidase domain-containing protein [unclassified Thalassospira]|uniref:zincin-like metallopeptidase domain-containing protein n=1 Tax=unclassified Thalassospira TaxID=2648997 RepID=UPI0025F3F41C|nr:MULTISPECIES: zincin-like metallopeptidase domain-containing protein [unclassified Thalassospira]|tara:strand:+ start:11204 stop:13360 length:2157 start_codon:yes stop_codon:yes gene_type:complete
MAEKKSYRDQVVEELLGHIEAGTAPWQKPWEPGKVRMAPFNPVSGKDYRGINALWLEMRGRSDPRWMTYRQATAQDAQVRKGEKGTMIEYWKWSEREKVLDENGKPVLDDKGVAKTRDVRLDRPRVFHAVVFNAEQIDGLAPYIAPEPTFSPVERAEQILKQGNVPIFHDQNDRAFYRSSTDQIHMPHQAAFKGQYEYYATALHELGHATGHGSRMAREFGPFGSEVYAKEELRAEIASYMLTTELGLGHYPERHAAYVGSWMKAIKEDRNALFTAARDAENIRTWIMKPDLRQSLIPETAKEQAKTIAQNPAVEQQKENAMNDEMSQAPNQDTNIERKRIYLNVPFSEKDEAKALGAKWDRRAKAWYARDNMELAPFKRWQETKAKAPEPRISPEQEFAEALKENGLILDGPPTMDGKWHRVAVEGDRKGQKSGSYRGFLEGLPAGNITNYKSGQDPVKWVATGTKVDPKELEQARAEAAARKAAQEQELRAQYRAIAKRAYGIFQNAEPAPSNHPYLQNKQVPAGDLRIDQSGNLLMPMANDKGFIENIQTIHPDGTKMYLKDGKKRGLMHVIEGDHKGPMIVTEGYSTGQSLHMASGLTVVVALDSGNLAPVAEAIHKKHPDRPLVIAADDDHAKKINAGIKGAERAAELTGAKILRPDLSDAEKAKGLTDFNDIHRERGIEALKRVVTDQLGLSKPKSRTRTRGREQQAASLAV